MMTMRRFIALMAAAGLIFALAACGGGGSKASQTKTPATKTPSVTGTVTPGSTAMDSGTPGAPAPTSQGGPDGGGDTTPASGGNGAQPTPLTGERTDYR